MEPIFVIGASGHAKVVIDIVEREGRLRVAGLIDQARPAGSSHFGCEVLGDEAALPALCEKRGVRAVIVAIGDNAARARVSEAALALVPGLQFATAVHPAASVARGVALGGGSVVMPGAVLGPDCAVGRHCIVNTGACLDHDGVLEDYASLGPGAVLGGNVTVGAFAHVGLGASVIHGVTIGHDAVVGAGAAVVQGVPPLTVTLGVPARVLRNREHAEKYY